jgi:DNA mismatch repair protein MutS
VTFGSILFGDADAHPVEDTLPAPECFPDLNLDQIVNAITARKQQYNLKPFFYSPLTSVVTIEYRQEIALDLENDTLLAAINAFAERMTVMRRYLGLERELTYRYHKRGWFLEAAAKYCEAVTELAQDLNLVELTSRGLLAFRDYLNAYAGSERFIQLLADITALQAELATVEYSVLIDGRRVRVSRHASEIDYSQVIEAMFSKFRQGATKDYTVDLALGAGMSHVEAHILEFVARLYPGTFAALDRFSTQHGHFVDDALRVFDREVQFYVAYLDYLAPLKQIGLPFCYPRIVTADKQIHNRDGFDLALARKLVKENTTVVLNDFYLEDKERIFVVTGPNQGGKTTFARSFGQLHYLASIGCSIPGREAQLFLFDRLYTHFEKEEDIRSLRGKLEEDLVRIHRIFEQATPNSIAIMNEIFTSTTLQDALLLGKKVLKQMTELDMLGVYVTFIDELTSLNEKTVSVMSTVVPNAPALRTFKIIRKPADGFAHALSIVQKHRLTYQDLMERFAL